MEIADYKLGNINESLKALDLLINGIKNKYNLPPVVIMDEHDRVVQSFVFNKYPNDNPEKI